MTALGKCPYQVLGVQRDATDDDLKDAYMDLVSQLDHDKNRDRKEADRKLRALNQAYEILSNPEERAKYDQRNSDGARPTTSEANEDRSSNGSGSSSSDSDSLFGWLSCGSRSHDYNSCESPSPTQPKNQK